NNLGNIVVNLHGPVVLSNRQGAGADVVASFAIGELQATDPASALNAFIGGSPAVDANWIIGGLNTNSNFAGTIVDGAGSGGSTSQSHVTKVGTGELVLSGFNTYTGDTNVFGGTLRMTTDTLADAGRVRVNSGGILHLDHGAQDSVAALILNGVSVTPGVWGSATSGAPNTSPLLAGSGRLNVLGVAIPGDFDGNGTVNAADLVIWEGAYNVNSLGDANGSYTTDGSDFLIWQRNLGMTAASPASGAVPEPAGAMLVLCGVLGGLTLRRRLA
ncbi:MAG TPA: autotransporter-associated beta strand repeat-containing protein, partial [Lacipirellulaceae bacterium]|nr:autotransporter-associated beta strand repeat-containing protein [Lacipirellulaceae bacterium]